METKYIIIIVAVVAVIGVAATIVLISKNKNT